MTAQNQKVKESFEEKQSRPKNFMKSKRVLGSSKPLIPNEMVVAKGGLHNGNRIQAPSQIAWQGTQSKRL